MDSLETLTLLEPFHIWTAETIAKRFHYRTPGVWVLSARIYSRSEPWRIETLPEWAGCKSWVSLDRSLPTSDLAPAISDLEAARRSSQLEHVLGRPLSTGTKEER
ncbi:MAG: hypothetical protein NVSMB14_15110 [Isosphaeraceae bacterium]